MTGRRPGAGGEAAHFRSSENQRRSLQPSAARERFQPRSLELSRPGGALPHQGDLRHLASIWRQRLWDCDFHRVPCEEPRVGHQQAINHVAVNVSFSLYLSLCWPVCPSCRCTPHSSPSQTPVRQARAAGRAGGGKGRNPDVLMEIQLSKVKCIFAQNKCSFLTL